MTTQPDDDDAGLWSLICAATPGLCGCDTRRAHEAGYCNATVKTSIPAA